MKDAEALDQHPEARAIVRALRAVCRYTCICGRDHACQSIDRGTHVHQYNCMEAHA